MYKFTSVRGTPVRGIMFNRLRLNLPYCDEGVGQADTSI